MDSLLIRKGRAEDLPQLRQLFSDTVMKVCINDYSEDQRKVWATTAQLDSRWTDLLHCQLLLVATREEQLIGFASLKCGYIIDMLYVHHQYQKQGVAHRLYEALETVALRQHQPLLDADVSITARSFFEKKGFKVLQLQQVERLGVQLFNFAMQKQLFPPI